MIYSFQKKIILSIVLGILFVSTSSLFIFKKDYPGIYHGSYTNDTDEGMGGWEISFDTKIFEYTIYFHGSLLDHGYWNYMDKNYSVIFMNGKKNREFAFWRDGEWHFLVPHLDGQYVYLILPDFQEGYRAPVEIQE